MPSTLPPTQLTVTQEIQSVVWNYREHDEAKDRGELSADPTLSSFAAARVLQCSYDVVEAYRHGSGVFWETTTAEQRYAATTAAGLHDDAVRAEYERFERWVNDCLYLSVDEAKDGVDYDMVQWLVDQLEKQRGVVPVYFVNLCDAVTYIKTDNTENFGHELYHIYRTRSGHDVKHVPVSLLVWLDMHRLCLNDWVRAKMESRVSLSPKKRKRISDIAVARAEADNARQVKAAKLEQLPVAVLNQPQWKHEASCNCARSL